MFDMEFWYDFAEFVYIMYSLHRETPLMLFLVFPINNRKELHCNTPMEQFIIISAVTPQISKLLK